MKNIVISGTNFWNPGDDFVREGVIRVLQNVFHGEPLNFLFYNFNPDFYPHEDQFAGSNVIARGDLEHFGDSVDAIVIVGVSAGLEVKPLYRWVLANGLGHKVYLISGHYENRYCADHISQQPEATIFRQARLVIGRTRKHPDFIDRAGIPYHYVNCPAILSVPEVKHIPPGKKIQRIGVSIQIPREAGGLVNQMCALEPYKLAVKAMCDLARNYPVELVAHHKSEYFHFLKLLQGTGIPVVFSSFYPHLFDIYRRYDLVVTTRLHASLFANGHGIPGIIINDTDRHTHTLEGFLHSPWVNTQAGYEKALHQWLHADLSAIAAESAGFKAKLLAQYVQLLRPVMTQPKPAPQAAAPARANSGPLDGAQRILFARTDSIGDAVLASAMLEPLRKQHPQAKLAVLCQEQVAPLFLACPFLESIICYDAAKMHLPQERQQIIQEITGFRPDIIINPVRSRDRLSDELTLAFANAAHIAIAGDCDNVTSGERDLAAARYECIVPTADGLQPELERHADFLNRLGVPAANLQPIVWTSAADEALAEAFFAQEKLDPARTLALFPFTQHAIKDYPNFPAALKDFIGWDIVLLGGPDTVARAEELASRLVGRVRNLAGRTHLGELAAILRRCKLLVGSDSCAAHIACAVGLPNVIVMGGGHFGRFLPYHPLTTVVTQPMDCFGCNWRCPHPSPHCITSVAPDVVRAALVAALNQRRAKPAVFAAAEGQPARLAAWLKAGTVDHVPVTLPTETAGWSLPSGNWNPSDADCREAQPQNLAQA